MLSVINRGSIVGSSGSLEYSIKYGYTPDCYNGKALATQVLVGIPTPVVLDGFPIVKNGYTSKTVSPTEG